VENRFARESSAPQPQVLLSGLAFCESPRWHAGCLWFANWGAQEIVAADLDGKHEVVADVPTTLPFSIDWLPDGRLLVASGPEGRGRLRLPERHGRNSRRLDPDRRRVLRRPAHSLRHHRGWESADSVHNGCRYEALFNDYNAYTDALKKAGVSLGGEALQPTDTATTVRLRDGKKFTTHGPFAETKEQLGGYYLLDCKNLDEALDWAAKCPGAQAGSIEVRPIMEFG
jgi:hypothetical protein